jgi:hypothetical protein
MSKVIGHQMSDSQVNPVVHLYGKGFNRIGLPVDANGLVGASCLNTYRFLRGFYFYL